MWLHLLTTTVLLTFGTTNTLSRGKELNITTILTKPYLQIKQSDTQLLGNDRFEGYIVDLVEEISKVVQFNYTFHLVADNHYGSMDESSSWNGMIGELVNGEADMAAAPLTVSPLRLRVVDFTVPFQTIGHGMVFKKAEKANPDLSTIRERVFRLLQPLDHMVWLTVLIAYLVTGFFLYVVSYCNPYEWRHLARDGLATYREAESFNCMNTYWFLLSTIVWQGYTRSPRSVGGRVITSFWWMFVVVFLITYTASLTNLLRFYPQIRTPSVISEIHSFDDLARQTNFRPIALKYGSTTEYLKSSKLASIERIWSNMEAHSDSLVPSTEAGLEKLRTSEEHLVLIMESTFANVAVNQNPCDLLYVEDIQPNRFYSLAFPMNSQYRTLVNEALMNIYATGVLQGLHNKWFVDRGQCGLYRQHTDKGNVHTVFKSVDMGSFSGALILLAAGIIAGCLLTAMEFCIFRIAEKEDKTEGIQETPSKKESDV